MSHFPKALRSLSGFPKGGDVGGLRSNAVHDLGRCSSLQTGGPKRKEMWGLAGSQDCKNCLLLSPALARDGLRLIIHYDSTSVELWKGTPALVSNKVLWPQGYEEISWLCFIFMKIPPSPWSTD